jgi:hypothetical protein
MRYWCLSHRADATAKYGIPAPRCRLADVPEPTGAEVLNLDIADFPGGIGIWGAVPAVYDTTRLPMEHGVHVHSRETPVGEKRIDWTYRRVVLSDSTKPIGVIDELDAIYYMVSRVLGLTIREVICGHCGHQHLDKDWFAVHAHHRHLCSGCGHYFRDPGEDAVGNPVVAIRTSLAVTPTHPKRINRKLSIRQAEYPAGIQIWASNPALLWTRPLDEEAGIHVHVYDDKGQRVFDDTYSDLVVDGISIDAEMLRIFMAQSTLPHLRGRLRTISCAHCQHIQFDTGLNAVIPRCERDCSACGREFSIPGRRKAISNPVVEILYELGIRSTQEPQRHDLQLLPETL